MTFTPEKLAELTRYFQELGQNGLTLNHYELAEQTEESDPQIWKAFLMEPSTSDFIRNEMDLIRGAQLNKMVQDSARSRSVGQSQLINALSKMDEKGTRKDGPVFIYCYVPLNPEQESASNVVNCEPSGMQITEQGVIILEDA